VTTTPADAGAALAAEGGGGEGAQQGGLSEQLEVEVSVKDGGMMLVTALTPDLRWQSGAAELALRVRGPTSQPQVCRPDRLHAFSHGVLVTVGSPAWQPEARMPFLTVHQ
jgi:hypothetical protein